MTAAVWSLELTIPCYCYYILVEVYHFKCASLIIHYANDSLTLTNVADGLSPIYTLEKEVKLIA